MIRRPKDKRGTAHKRTPKQEKATAKRVGGRRIAWSGSKGEKGDVRVERVIRIETKNTTKKSFSVTREMVEKIETAALMSGEAPAIEIEFINDEGKRIAAVAVVPTYVIDHITNESNEQTKEKTQS